MKNSHFGAFACASSDLYQTGLTKREYFAGLAMQGLLANPDFSKSANEVIARISVYAADELLKELEQTKQD